MILLHNRRGFSPVLRCKDCGEVETCPHCQVALTYHKLGEFLQCHFCNHIKKQLPTQCKDCQSFSLQLSGVGTQKVEEELTNQFPEAIIERLDADTTKSGKNIADILQRFSDGEIYVEINENIRGNSIFVVQSTDNPAIDNLMELLICIDAIR